MSTQQNPLGASEFNASPFVCAECGAPSPATHIAGPCSACGKTIRILKEDFQPRGKSKISKAAPLSQSTENSVPDYLEDEDPADVDVDNESEPETEESENEPASPLVDPYSEFPAELKKLAQWVCYRLESKENSKKPTKVPYVAGANYGASTTKPADWRTYECALTHVANYSGLGFVFEPPYVGIDIDGCVDNGAIAAWAWAIIEQVGSYAEFSPSGTGIHIIVRGALPSAAKIGAVEMYTTARFFTVTGKHVPGTPLEISERDLISLHTRVKAGEFPKAKPDVAKSFVEKTISMTGGMVVSDTTDKSDSGKEFRLILDLIREMPKATADEIEAVFRLRHSNLYREKWDAKRSGKSYLLYSIERALIEIANQPEEKSVLLAGAEPSTKPSAELQRELEKDAAIAEFVTPKATDSSVAKIEDMGSEVLVGRLGEICQDRMADFPTAFSWQSLVTAAGALVSQCSPSRTTNYCALVGGPGVGKSQALQVAQILCGYWVGPRDGHAEPAAVLPVVEIYPGSIEGLLDRPEIKGANGEPRILFIDELSALLKRASLEGSNMAPILNRAWNKTYFVLTTKHGKPVSLNCQLSVAGGITIVDGNFENFGDLFGAESVTGFYDRFTFGLAPTGYQYAYRPFPLQIDPRLEHPKPYTVNADVYEAANDWAKRYGLNRRILEVAVRNAGICCAIDGRSELRAKDIEVSTLAWVRYQERVRLLLKPNTGVNDDGKLANKIMGYIDSHGADGQWLSQRDLLRAIRARDYGTRAAQVLNALEYSDDIERQVTQTAGRSKVVLRKVIGSSE